MKEGVSFNLAKEWRLILCLVLAAGALRTWHLVTTEVTARDSIHFFRIAWQLENESWKPVLSKATQHPGYPIAVLGMGKLTRPFFPNDLPMATQVAGQLVSILASLLLVIPVYGLGRSQFGPWGAFLGTLLVQVLPGTARLFPDGLSEALFLLFVFSSIWLFHVGMMTAKVSWIGISGVLSGLAYLTRPEGGLVFLATFLVLVFLLGVKRFWGPGSRKTAGFLGVCALTLGFSLPAVPFALTIGKLTTKPTATRIMQSDPSEVTLQSPRNLREKEFPGTPLLAAWYDFKKEGAPGIAWGIWATTGMVIRGLLFSFWLPALCALWKLRTQIMGHPGALVQSIVATGIFAALVRVAANLGYVSDRHLVLIIVPSLLLAGGMLVEWAGILWCQKGKGESLNVSLKVGRVVFVILGLAALIGTARLTMAPLHANRAGFRVAGYWIRENGKPGDEVVDPYQWSHYYAGRVFLESSKVAQVRSDPPVHWVVFEKGKSKHVRLNLPEEEEVLAKGGKLAFETIEGRYGAGGDSSKKILVYQVPVTLPVPAK